MTNSLNQVDPKDALMERRVKYAKMGLIVAIMTGVAQGFGGTVADIAGGMWPFYDETYGILTLIICAYITGGLIDFFNGCWIFIWNKATRRPLAEYIRIIKTKIGVMLIVGGFLGGPCATGALMVAIFLCGPTYALAICGLYPVFGVLSNWIVLKEKLPGRAWAGVIIVIVGATIISYSPPDGDIRPYFAVGIAFAIFSGFCYGVEGTFVSYAGDMVDPMTASGIWRCWVSGIFQIGIIVPVLSIFAGDITTGWTIVGQAFSTGTPVLAIIIAAIGTGGAIYGFYPALDMCGVGRTMALCSVAALWSIVWTSILSLFGIMTLEITGVAIVGCFVVITGALLCIANPKELIRLR